MMAKRLGNDARLWIKLANGTWAQISGNQSLARSYNAQTIDTSTKSDFPWGTQAPGSRGGSITASFLPDLPDPGFERLSAIALASVATTAEVQIRTGGDAGASPADVIFEGLVYITDFGDNMDQNSAHTHSCTLVFAAAPTIWAA